MNIPTIIEIKPPLPCGTVGDKPGKICGKPATAAHVYKKPGQEEMDDLAGEWTILPICKECALATDALYREKK